MSPFQDPFKTLSRALVDRIALLDLCKWLATHLWRIPRSGLWRLWQSGTMYVHLAREQETCGKAWQ